MKTILLKSLTKSFFLIFSIICSTALLYAQESNRLSKFLILVETNDDGIKLTGLEGCAFKELTYSYRANQAISQYGMVSKKMIKNGDSEGFLFTIKKTNTGLSFEGLKGTAWKNLNFTCPNGICHQYIDQNGITHKKLD